LIDGIEKNEKVINRLEFKKIDLINFLFTKTTLLLKTAKNLRKKLRKQNREKKRENREKNREKTREKYFFRGFFRDFFRGFIFAVLRTRVSNWNSIVNSTL